LQQSTILSWIFSVLQQCHNMPPKAEAIDFTPSETYLKSLDKNLRGLMAVRGLIWRAQPGKEEQAVLGVYSEELRLFLTAVDEFLAPDDPQMAAARGRYACIARHRLLRPQLQFLRGLREGPVIPKEMAPVVLSVLAALAALFVWARHKDTAAARSLPYYEAFLAAEPATLMAVTDASIKTFVSVLDFIDAKKPAISDRTEGKHARVDACFVCGQHGHIAKFCKRRV
jgi:hypothetical protein